MKTICIFGDSIVWGAGLSSRVSWADLIRSKISKSDTGLSVYNLGIDAENTRGLLKRFGCEVKARNPEIIIIAEGTNDSIFWQPNKVDVSIAEFKKNITELILKARKYTNDIIFVGLAKGIDRLTVPLPVSATGKCFTKKRIREYNNVLKEIVLRNKLRFVDIKVVLSDEDFLDGLHPNEKGHQKIFEIVKKELQNEKII